MIIIQFSKNILAIILIFASLSGIALLGGRLVLEEYYVELTSHVISSTEKYRETNNTIKNINNTLIRTEKIQAEYKSWSNLLADITEAIPEPITLSHLNFDQAGNLYLDGQAENRQDLFILKEKLSKLIWLEELIIPPDQLIKKEDISFNLLLKTKI